MQRNFPEHTTITMLLFQLKPISVEKIVSYQWITKLIWIRCKFIMTELKYCAVPLEHLANIPMWLIQWIGCKTLYIELINSKYFCAYCRVESFFAEIAWKYSYSEMNVFTFVRLVFPPFVSSIQMGCNAKPAITFIIDKIVRTNLFDEIGKLIKSL